MDFNLRCQIISRHKHIGQGHDQKFCFIVEEPFSNGAKKTWYVWCRLPLVVGGDYQLIGSVSQSTNKYREAKDLNPIVDTYFNVYKVIQFNPDGVSQEVK